MPLVKDPWLIALQRRLSGAIPALNPLIAGIPFHDHLPGTCPNLPRLPMSSRCCTCNIIHDPGQALGRVAVRVILKCRCADLKLHPEC